MKLITEKGQLPLPADFEIQVEKNSPFFSDDGTASIPVTIPASADVLGKLGNPERLASANGFLRKISATLQSGVIRKNGQLIIDSIATKSGITASLALDESDLYVSYKDTSLREIFEGVVDDRFADSADKIGSWALLLQQLSSGQQTGDFTAFPVAVNRNTVVTRSVTESDTDEDSSYQYLNEPDVSNDSDTVTFWPFLYKSRVIYENETYITVPDGYGLTAFPWLHRYLVLLFKQLGYTLNSNPFTVFPLNKICLVNNCADTFCKGHLKWSDISPSVTLSEFLDCLEKKFHAQAFINPETKIADIRMFEDIATEGPDICLDNKLDDEMTVKPQDAKQVKLIPDQTLEGAEPAAETKEKLIENYPLITPVSSGATSNYYVFYRKALGDFWKSSVNGTSGAKIYKRLGSNNFTYFKDTMKAEEFTASDVTPVMTAHKFGQRGVYALMVQAEFIGDKIHLNSSYENESEDTEQKVIFIYSSGISGNDVLQYSKYCHGTCEKYNNIGVQWCDFSLHYDELYNHCWKLYNEALMNNAAHLTGKFILDNMTLQQWRMDKTKRFKGQRLLPIALTYNISDKAASVESSEFLLLQAKPNEITDTASVYTDQKYMWVRHTNLEDILKKYPEDQDHYDSWNYQNSGADAYTSDLPPTAATDTFDAGTVTIIITVTDNAGHVLNTSTEEMHIWYTAAEMDS